MYPERWRTPHILSVHGDNKWGHHTSKFDHMFILGWGHCTKFQTLAVGRVDGSVGYGSYALAGIC